VVRTNNAWYTLGGPSTSLMVAADSAIDSRTVTRYDGAGRQVETVAYQGLTEKRRARTVYGGNQVTTLPPEGGTASTTISDARGNTATLLAYRETPIVDGWSVTGGDPAVTNYRYDTSGRMVQMTDAVGAQWTKNYDLLGRNTSATDPDTGTTTTTFNDVGDALATTDARGVTVASEYDKLGRPVQQSAGQTVLARWTYDTLRPGALTSVTSYTDGNAYTQRVDAYDHAGRPTSATVVIPSAEGALAGSYTTKTTYTQAGQTRTISYPKTGDLPAETVTYSYNTQGMPTTLAGAQTYVKAASWSPHGALSQTIHNQTSSIAQTFYRDPETLRVNEQQLSNTGAYSNVDKTLYTYDQVGKITQTYSERGNGVSTGYRTACYQYNGLSQLTTAWTEAGNQLTPHCATTPSVADGSMVSGAFAMWHEYEWDAVGNRQKITVHPTAITPVGHATTSTYSYGDASYHALDQTTTDNAVDTSYTYDPAGNTLTRQTADFTEQWAWTPTGKTKSITRDAAVTSYVYTADGTQLIRHDPDTTATLYLPDGTELAAKTSGLEATRYYNFGGQTITQKTKTATWILYADQTGTATVAHHSTTLTTYTRRTIDPYGNQIGPTMGGAWPNTRG